MATDKYDLHTIDYSVQGWDTIMATDMEILDDEINTRILCTLGETIAVNDVLYLHTDEKYYKAQADGIKQPAMGLALETGILNDSIRIQRVGPVTDVGWSWSSIGSLIFLSSSAAGELTESEPESNSQTIGVVLSSTSIFIDVDTGATSSGTGGGTSVHNDLSGLNDGDYKHLTATNHTDLTDSGVCTIHKHDISEDTTPELGGQLVVGENDIKLDSLLSADGKYSGETFDGVLGATLAYGDLVYLNTTDQRWEATDASAEATSGGVAVALVLAAGNDGDTRLLLREGFIREDDWNFTSYGQAIYISTTAGDITQTTISGSGNIVRVVGYVSTFADQIEFKPSQTWLELV